ncbi:hypothetical protein Nepgr_018880 [Nepenthes gracilis]|uniref:Pentatricopeptide repeat-containing protein n=1 Tax=Nepenthes gracilis TaxID=150966 RepID=A0AAD3XUG1_NEPGR|nr:hypothetical protein Nepgr_018880 [Nepenthes gracilis]
MLVAERISASPTNSRYLQQHIFSVLQNCCSIKKLAQIHAHILTNGFSQKNFILAKLISLYSAYGYVDHAQKVFDKIGSPSTTIWNQMIRAHARGETPVKSVELFTLMQKEESEPDGYTYSYMVAACSLLGLLRVGEQIHSRVLSNGYCSNLFVSTSLVNLYTLSRGDVGLESACKVFEEMPERSVVTWNSLLAGYIRCGDVDRALRTFDEMPERSVVSWTTMVSGCARQGRSRQALSLFSEMMRAQVELDQVAMISALSACAELGDLNLGRWIHSYVNRAFRGSRQQLLVPLQNALIHMYASCGVVEEAHGVFEEMPRKTTVSWTSMIIGYAKHGYGEKALSLFQRMQELEADELRPDAITFIGVLCACSHAGYVEEGRRYFIQMKERWAIEPRIEHYGCMADILSRAGFLDEAESLVESMPMKPNDAIWGALLGGCRIHMKSKLALSAAQNLMLKLDCDQTFGYLALLLDVYAVAKRWEDVAIVRQKMVEMGVRKPPGRSWVQTNGVIHDFLAGDSTHKQASSIYDMLDNMTGQLVCEENKHNMYDLGEDVEGANFPSLIS